MAFSAANIAHARAFRISPKDTNYFVMLFDKDSDKIDNIFVIEIFRAGGATFIDQAPCRMRISSASSSTRSPPRISSAKPSFGVITVSV